MNITISSSKEELAEDFAEYLLQLSETGEQVHVALSGGSTPKAIFDFIAENLGDTIQWKNIHLYWGDERCVPPTDPESNFKMTVDHLLSKIEMPESNIHRVLGENDPASEAVRYGALLEKNLPKNDGIPQFDLVMLGMGDDGHTVSIFPNAIELWDAEENCVVATHPDSGQKRVTITGKIVNNAKAVAFLVTGKNKAEKLEEIIYEHGDFESYPASLVKPKSGNLIWYVDEEAAANLEV
ncbi:6-phosphogluconolactonase [Algoriphagus pacificus]|uniref:6-phosphogluconolactonase n=1 Tax=Algoriphagus pacificus TaxID=2811234 RepID=A0ABS3CCI1_9BACT|nr:6-phosphogluconolactonase [Algoriphagus pacificus]MBN7814806.1 6-phosphogluconolactonase [Algoriphagus pacificus]